jgi:hypothetical protein
MLTTAVGMQRASGPFPSLITSTAGGQSRSFIYRPSLSKHQSRHPRTSKLVSNAYDPRDAQQLASLVATPHSGYHFDGTPRRCRLRCITSKIKS